ncbi:MAG: TlpA family protein disulfide reductase [Deltaproteobacteria bacterium]|nr:TlpA family protein disulfide reductase [Deltaproteobacteria bacterium]
MRGWKIPVAAAALLACFATGAPAIEVGKPAVPFTLTNPVTQMEVSLPAALEKNPALIVFFNTSCAACEAELVAAKNYLHNNPNAFKLFAIAIDSTSDARARVSKFIEDKGLGVAIVLLDPKFEVAEKYGFNFTPAAVGIDKEGKVKFVVNGFSRTESKVFTGNLESLK